MSFINNLNMQNSSGLNKNILILTVVLFALIIALGVMFMLAGGPSAPFSAPIISGSTTQAIDKNVAELDNFNADLISFNNDDAIAEELDTTLSEVGEIGGTSAGLKKDEENLADLDSDLTNLSNDEKVNEEIDQSLKDVSL